MIAHYTEEVEVFENTKNLNRLFQIGYEQFPYIQNII